MADPSFVKLVRTTLCAATLNLYMMCGLEWLLQFRIALPDTATMCSWRTCSQTLAT